MVGPLPKRWAKDYDVEKNEETSHALLGKITEEKHHAQLLGIRE